MIFQLIGEATTTVPRGTIRNIIKLTRKPQSIVGHRVGVVVRCPHSDKNINLDKYSLLLVPSSFSKTELLCDHMLNSTKQSPNVSF